MYSIFVAVSEARIKEWHDQAANDRLVRQACRARREAARATSALPRRWPGSRWVARRAAAAVPAQRVTADATPDQWASALSPAAAELADGADDREPVGGGRAT